MKPKLIPVPDANVERTYDVWLNDTYLGQVFPTWKRQGGNGWTWKAKHSTTGHRVDTRKIAVSKLLQEARA